MINTRVVLLTVSLSSVMSHMDKVDESNYLLDRITDCFFINNDVERVELVCDNISGNYPTDICYSSLFLSESKEIHRSKVKHLQSGQCKSKNLDSFDFGDLSEAFPNITDLNLSFRGAQHVLYPSQCFAHLKVLNVSHNEIGFHKEVMVDNLEIWGNFDVLDVSFNDLKLFMSWRIYFLGNITSLNLSYNSIENLSSTSLSRVLELRVLDLRNNQIAHLDEGAFRTVSNTLQLIHLQNNKIKHFVVSLNIKTLVYLNLSGNQIENYNQHQLSYFSNSLQYLDLSRNKIEHIVVGYEIRKVLKSLDVSYNRIRTFNYSYDVSAALDVLNLEGNDLDQLDTITPSKFPNLTTIAISKNRFDCEYAKRFTRQWINITIIGDLCDQKDNGIEPVDYSILYSSIGLFGCLTIIAAASHRFIRYKTISAKKQEIVENENIECRSSDQYEEPLPFVEPIYHEIDYAATSAPNSSHANRPYDHLTRDPMPLSPIQLHYDNLKKSNKGPLQIR